METTDGDAAALLSELIAIDSSNPDLVPGAAGESAIADFVSAWLARRGFAVHRLESTPGRPSIVAVTTGTGGGRSLMLNGHLDTVTLAGFDGDPLEPVIRDGSMHGRGAFGMKSGLAAMMAAAAEAGIPCLRFGADGGGAHAANEWVTLESLETVTSVLHGVIIDYCGTSSLGITEAA